MPLPRSSASISRPWASPSRSVRRMTSPPRPCLTTFDAASVTAMATLPTTSSSSPAPEARRIAARRASPGWPVHPIGTDTGAAVIDGVARDLAGRGHDLRLIDQTESELDRPPSDDLADPDDVLARANRPPLTFDDRHGHLARRERRAAAPCPSRRSTPCAHPGATAPTRRV